MIPDLILGAAFGTVASGAVFYLLQKSNIDPLSKKDKGEAKKRLSSAHDKAEEIEENAREKARKIRAKVEELEESIVERKADLDKRTRNLEDKEEELSQQKQELRKMRNRLKKELEKRAGLTRKEAEEKLLSSLEKDLQAEKARRIKEFQEETELEADEKAKEILVDAMEKASTDYVAETTVSIVHLPNDEMKGRIIGREGRNIKALERATGVDFEIDETPEEVRVSSFDPLRREIARRSLERLVADGRIQPSRIEETVKRVKNDFNRDLRKIGKDLAYKAGVSGLPMELLENLGKLKFRTSYGQNQAEHTLEVINIAKALAKEVGARVKLVAKAALLHDIGKVKTIEEGEGSHVELGKSFLRKHGLADELIHTAMAHHRDDAFQNIEAALVYIADAISGSRPGARVEDYDSYVQRIESLENIAQEFEGVKEAYAISAGREVRVLVSPQKISDDEATVLAHDLSEKIQEQATYPGTVKVNVIRETRASATAK
ncbi:MAG: ribonuclease Y [Patescibacteria group bacterium]